MRLVHGRHLAFCPDTPCHGSWMETFEALRGMVLPLRDQVCRFGEGFGICLPLGDLAARELLTPRALSRFRRWLRDERCEVLSINDAAAGEAVGGLDWTHPERLAHTCRLLDLLEALLPEGQVGSVTAAPGLPGKLDDPRRAEAPLQAIYANLIRGAIHAAEVRGRTGRLLRFAFEPGEFGPFENMAEIARFLEPLTEAFPEQFGVCFDLTRYRVISGKAAEALAALDRAEIQVVKMRLGSARRTREDSTDDEVSIALDWLAANPSSCPQLEIGPWEAPPGSVVEECGRAYHRILSLLAARGLA